MAIDWYYNPRGYHAHISVSSASMAVNRRLAVLISLSNSKWECCWEYCGQVSYFDWSNSSSMRVKFRRDQSLIRVSNTSSIVSKTAGDDCIACISKPSIGRRNWIFQLEIWLTRALQSPISNVEYPISNIPTLVPSFEWVGTGWIERAR